MSGSSSTDDTPSDHIAYFLTSRQQEIACLATQGLSERQIADRLYLSPATVHEHMRHIYDRLGIHSRAELVAAVVRSGICEPEK